MKCLCFSDSHGSPLNIRRALNMHPDAEILFFLGDGLDDLEPFLRDKNRAILAVRGNCDRSAVLGDVIVKKTDEITIENRRIVFTHGDLYGAKYGLDGLRALAEEKRADILLFGHTHLPLERYIPTDEGGYYLFNPGSIGGGFGTNATFGVISISESGILLSHGAL